ncbi:MAG: hypothetical protein L6R42_005789 [Xanthoria sp. 1 TBL-2021]|nr:MAG: hypothetical protein L6R42_005789 [Xanthoria sp. 1 TBL-2021]
MARRRDSPSAEYISLHSRATSPDGSNWTHPREEPAVHEAPPTVNSKNLDYRQQAWSLLLPQAIRWLGTVLLSILLMSVVWIYQNKGNFTRTDKNVFNVIITGLSVGLGINFFLDTLLIELQEAFKESAKGLRWRKLADKRHNDRKVDLILGIESLWKVFLLAIESFSSSPWTIVACTVWVSTVNALSYPQVFLAGGGSARVFMILRQSVGILA